MRVQTTLAEVQVGELVLKQCLDFGIDHLRASPDIPQLAELGRDVSHVGEVADGEEHTQLGRSGQVVLFVAVHLAAVLRLFRI